ncbi:MAG: hypothetical protein HC782_05820 [Gammaproteobacteria bacterium]|nr:hypothetical protein [Gammaproteobacteria bacterium]
MNQDTLKIFAQVKLAARKAGLDVDLAKLVSDKDYARQELDKLIASGFTDVAALAKQAKATLTSAPPAASVVMTKEVTPTEVTAPPEKPDKKICDGCAWVGNSFHLLHWQHCFLICHVVPAARIFCE